MSDSPMVLERLFGVLERLDLVSQIDLERRGTAIDVRRLDRVHGCVFCPARAAEAFILGPSDLVGAARWVDACPPHGHALREMALQIGYGIDDAEIVERYDRWLKRGS